jgi:basic membrane protein A and related proteins
MSRKRLSGIAALAAGAVAVVAVAAAASATQEAGKVTKVAIAAPDKANNYGWDQQGVQGARRAAKAVGATIEVAAGVGYDNTEAVLRQLAQRGANFIIAQASGYNTIAPRIAQQYNVPVITYDAPKNLKKGILADIETSSQQGAYLAGMLAASLTKTGKLGIVISAADTNWFKQAGGFAAGARKAKKSVKFKLAQIGPAGYSDAAGGKRVTQSVIAAGADIIFGMGDGSSFGMLQAVETAKAGHKVWFIDVIGNKTPIDKKKVLLSSVIWDFTKVFTTALKDVNAGRYGTHTYNLNLSNGISLLKTRFIPAGVWSKIQSARGRIIAGKTKVPLTPTRAAVNRLIK